jgi:hypothetical protein
VGLGLCLVRLAGCESWTEALMPAGLTVLEIGVVLLLEWHASGLRPRHGEWRARNDAIDKATRDRQAARDLLGERRARVEAMTASIDGHIRYVERRRICNAKVGDIESAAVKAVRDGYHAGLAENRGRARGLRKREAGR